MRIFFLVICLLSFTTTFAQQTDTVLAKHDSAQNANQPARNMYGDLLRDDPAYNPRSHWYIVSARVLATNVVNWGAARYIYKKDWTSSGIKDWKNSFTKGPEWDTDGFGINFIGHPHSGNYYFNVARSNGYSYWGSFPFALQGSLMWEYFGENTRPSYNDMINTPISGMFLGEIFYRISSNILDDRATGTERVFRELLAGVIIRQGHSAG